MFMVDVGKTNYISPMDPMEKQYTYPALTAMFVEFNHQLHQKVQENIYKSKPHVPIGREGNDILYGLL